MKPNTQEDQTDRKISNAFPILSLSRVILIHVKSICYDTFETNLGVTKATKTIIYSNRNSTSKLYLKKEKLVMKYLFQSGKYCAETNDKLAIFLGAWHPTYDEMTYLRP